MEFRLKAAETTKWLRVTDWNNKAKLHEPKISVVGEDGNGAAVSFDVQPSGGSNPQRGYVQVEVARNVSEAGPNRPSTKWAIHSDEMQPEIGQTYTIDDEHLPTS
jgi:hypothetical protein